MKLADLVDPGAPQVKALVESATLGRQQEQRRRHLETITHRIEEALNRDDYVAACQLADEGLPRFPEDRTLSKLKSLASKKLSVDSYVIAGPPDAAFQHVIDAAQLTRDLRKRFLCCPVTHRGRAAITKSPLAVALGFSDGGIADFTTVMGPYNACYFHRRNTDGPARIIRESCSR